MPTDISKIISDAAYQAYERRLLHQVRQAAIPHHVAIIMDGNRRFAREIGLGNVLDGHVKGRDKLEEVLEWCLEVGVRILTVYAFSTENLRRPSEEIQHLMHLFAVHCRSAGSGLGLAHERRGADLELPPVAARLFRTVFCGRLLARFPQDRLPPRVAVVPDAAATVRGVGTTGALKSPCQLARAR